MKFIGIDYGEKKSGIAFADGPLAEPVLVLYHKDTPGFIKQLKTVVIKYEPECLVVGMPSGTQGEEVKEIVKVIEKNVNVPVETIDEGFSTKEAQMLSREAGHRRKKRRSMEDAFSASIILQKYLDSI